MYVHMYVEVRAQRQVSSSVAFCLKTSSLTEPGAHQLARPASEPQGAICLCPLASPRDHGYTPLYPQFYMGTGVQNQVLLVYQVL